jgi:hypothetical protein
MKRFIFFLAILFAEHEGTAQSQLNKLAEAYVRLGLEIGQYDSDFVDAYYGPDSLKPKLAKLDSFPASKFLDQISILRLQLKTQAERYGNAEEKNRAGWIEDQLRAFERRVKIFSGEKSDFDTEARELFGVDVPVHSEAYFTYYLEILEKTLPGPGSVLNRLQDLSKKFLIPRNKLDTVFKAAIAFSREQTAKHFKLPASEFCTLDFVKNKSWSGYNWYQGRYRSKVEINTDLNIFIERAIDVASHESYPGHHVYNLLLEKNLYRDKDYIEISLYPLFSPQSLIAEGSANYGVGLAFPDSIKLAFTKNVLLPLAGLDTNGITAYYDALKLKEKLNYARNEVARGLINGTMTEAEGQRWLESYALMPTPTARKSIDFIKKYRSYVINYNYGLDLVAKYVQTNTNTAEQRWKKFGNLLSNQVRIGEMK